MGLARNAAWLALAAGLLALPAAGADVPGFTPRITDVTVFKDGHALVMASGTARFENGWCSTRQVPVPVLGTFWAFVADDEVRLDLVKAGWVQADQPRPCMTFEEIIKANTGKMAIIVEEAGRTPPVSHQGRLLGLLQAEAPPDAEGQRGAPGERADALRSSVPGRPAPEGLSPVADFVMLKSGTGTDLIRRANIRSMSFPEETPATTYVQTGQVREISMHAASGGQPFQGEKEVGVVYLQKGIRWIPDYRIELLEGGKARLLLQGTVINELADMDNADLRLVVGVPNFLMKDELSPMALREVGLRLSSYFAPPGGRAGGRRDLYLSNVMMSQAAAEVGERGAPAGGPNIPSEGQLEDLYLYRKSGLTLKKGESAVLKLLEVTVPYEDVYTWDVPPLPPLEMWRYVNSDEQRTALQKLSGAKALHKIRLLNTGDTPWTTGPAAIFRAGLPLGQDLLSFTSVKNKADVTVTTATDLNTKKEETEVGRQENSIRISGDAYTKVSLHGKLTVTNFKDRDIRLELTRKAIGKATAASADGRITALNAVEDKSTADEWGLPLWQSWPYWWFAANPLSSIAWEAVIPAGQTATFEYDLYYYYHP